MASTLDCCFVSVLSAMPELGDGSWGLVASVCKGQLEEDFPYRKEAVLEGHLKRKGALISESVMVVDLGSNR